LPGEQGEGMEQSKQQPQVPKQDASRGVKDTGEVKHHDAHDSGRHRVLWFCFHADFAVDHHLVYWFWSVAYSRVCRDVMRH
jgi:hypothetical protein